MKPGLLFKSNTAVLLIFLNFHWIQSSPIPVRDRDEYEYSVEGVDEVVQVETTTTKYSKFLDDSYTATSDSRESASPIIDEQISSTPVLAHQIPINTIKRGSKNQSESSTPPSVFQCTPLPDVPEGTTQAIHTNPTDNISNLVSSEQTDEISAYNLDKDLTPSISDEFIFPAISHSHLAGRSLYDENKYENDGFDVWVTLRLNEVRMNLNNHARQNNDYFSQIIAKFGRIDKTIQEIKTSIDDLKTSTINKFTETRNTMKEKETHNRQRLLQLNSMIKGNKASINTNDSQAKQDRQTDKRDAQTMKTGLDSQIRKLNDKVRDQMDLIDARMRALEEQRSKDVNPRFNLTNAVYNLTAAGLKLNHKLEWYSEEDDIQMCQTKGKEVENCQNYIRVLSVVSPGKILVCGTNAYKPRCRNYHLATPGHYSQTGVEKTGQGICPYDPKHNSTSAYVDGEVYAGTVADFTEVDPLIHRWDNLRTTQYDLKYLNAPNFVGSMQYEDFVFFYFRETSEEFNNCGKAVYSRVGRVCKSDKGFPRGSSRNRWTTFFKARLNCSIPGEFPFYFDEIQATSALLPSSQLGNEVVYGVFSTGVNSITGSAVCAYRMRDVLDVFDGRFKSQQSANMHWLPVAPEKVPEPRPGLCQNDSTTLPDQYYIFVAGHTLMDEPVQPLLGRPVLTRSSEPYRLTAIAVHTNATTPDGQAYDVIFIGTDDGKVLSVVNVGRDTVRTVMIQEMQVFNTPVREMLFLGGSPPKLLVGSDQNLKLMNVRQCFTSKIKSCSDCVALQSPYCAWHKRESKCVTIPLDRPISRREYIQNVSTGNHSDCPKPSSMSSNAIPSEQHKSTSKSLDSSGSQTITILSDDGHPTKEVANEGPVVVGPRRDSYTAETLSIAVGVGCVLAVLLGFIAGWGCAKRCRKDHDNIPYPDTDYEYFEQRHNLNINTRLVGEGKEEATYAEPVLDVKNNSHVMPQVNHQPDHQETTMFHFAQPYARDLYRFEGDLNSRGRPDAFGSLRPGGGMHLDGYGTAHRQPNLGPKANLPINDGYGTARSVKKVYL